MESITTISPTLIEESEVLFLSTDGLYITMEEVSSVNQNYTAHTELNPVLSYGKFPTPPATININITIVQEMNFVIDKFTKENVQVS